MGTTCNARYREDDGLWVKRENDGTSRATFSGPCPFCHGKRLDHRSFAVIWYVLLSFGANVATQVPQEAEAAPA